MIYKVLRHAWLLVVVVGDDVNIGRAVRELRLMLMKRLATWPPSKTQSTVSPAITLAAFSSEGSSISVD